MVEDVSCGVGWVLSHISAHGGDSQQVYLMGQSCGGHLAMLALLRQCKAAAARRCARASQNGAQLSTFGGRVDSLTRFSSDGSALLQSADGSFRRRSTGGVRANSRRHDWAPEHIRVRCTTSTL